MTENTPRLLVGGFFLATFDNQFTIGGRMKIDVKVTISFAPKSRILKWVLAEKAQKALAVWLIGAGLRVSGSSEMIVTPKLWSTHEKQLADKS